MGAYGLGVDVEVGLEVFESPELAGTRILPVPCNTVRLVFRVLQKMARRLWVRG